MITMKKTKGLLALAIGVALCFAVSAYALTAPRDTQGSISDNASAQPVEEPWWKEEDIFTSIFEDFPDINAVKEAADAAYSAYETGHHTLEYETKSGRCFYNGPTGMLMAVCNQADSRNNIYSKEMGIWVPSALSENLQISQIRIVNTRGMIFITFNDEQGNLAAELCSLYTADTEMLSEKLESDGIDYNGQRYIINCDFFSTGEIRCITNRYDTSYSQNVQWLQNGRHYKMRIYNGSYTEQELLDMCSLTRIDF